MYKKSQINFENIQQACSLMRDNRYKEALSFFTKIRGTDLTNTSYVIGEATALRGNNEPQKAIALLTECINQLKEKKQEVKTITPNLALSYHCSLLNEKNKAARFKKAAQHALLKITQIKTQAMKELESAEFFYSIDETKLAHDCLKMIGEYKDYYPLLLEKFIKEKATQKEKNFLERFLTLRSKVHLELNHLWDAYDDFKELKDIGLSETTALEGIETIKRLLKNEKSSNTEDSTNYENETMSADLPKEIQEAIDRGEHPGEFIRRELVEPSGLKIKFIAKKIVAHENTLSRLINSKVDLSSEMAVKLEFYFKKYRAEDLTEIQKKYDLAQAMIKVRREIPELDPTPT